MKLVSRWNTDSPSYTIETKMDQMQQHTKYIWFLFYWCTSETRQVKANSIPPKCEDKNQFHNFSLALWKGKYFRRLNWRYTFVQMKDYFFFSCGVFRSTKVRKNKNRILKADCTTTDSNFILHCNASSYSHWIFSGDRNQSNCTTMPANSEVTKI